MGLSHWNFYESPPKSLVDSLGKTFKEREKGYVIKVDSFMPLVSYLLDEGKKEDREKFGNLPSLPQSLVIFEILSGEFSGQKLAMESRNFFRLFSLLP